MSEATPTPEPQPPADAAAAGPAPSAWPVPSDPTAPPPATAPGPWAPPDPLAAPQPWAAPDPWSPTSPPAGTGTPPVTHPGTPPVAGPGTPVATGTGIPPWSPAVPSPPSPGHQPWPPYAAPAWPPPGYPPPFAHPGAPPPRTNGGRIAAVVVALATVLVVGICGCFVASGFLATLQGDRSVAEDPYDPYYDEPDDGGWTMPPAEPTTSPTRTQRPVTRPTSGPAPVTVVYEVTGDGRADIAYFDAESDLIHVDEVKLPWRMTIRTNGTSRVMVEATWSDGSFLPISCRVTVSGAGDPVVDAVDGVWRTTCSPE